MGEGLNEQVLAVVVESGLGDYEQRSAIGMARSWLDQGEMKLAGEGLETLYRGRDVLAGRLVDVIREAGREEAIAALREARAVVNEPFLDVSMVGWRVARLKVGIVGSDKKNTKISV